VLLAETKNPFLRGVGRMLETVARRRAVFPFRVLYYRSIPPIGAIPMDVKNATDFRGDIPLAKVFLSTACKITGSGLLAQAGYLSLSRPRRKTVRRDSIRLKV
jgi:hypothetical protein